MSTSSNSKQSDKPLKQKTLTSFLNGSAQLAISTPAKSKTRKPPVSSQRPRVERAPSPKFMETNGESDDDSSGIAAIRFEPEVDLSDEDASPRRPTARRRGGLATQAHEVKLDDDEKDDFFSTRSDSSSSEYRKDIRLGKRKQVTELSESEDEHVQPRRRKLIKGTRPLSIDSDDENLLEEVEEHRKP